MTASLARVCTRVSAGLHFVAMMLMRPMLFCGHVFQGKGGEVVTVYSSSAAHMRSRGWHLLARAHDAQTACIGSSQLSRMLLSLPPFFPPCPCCIFILIVLTSILPAGATFELNPVLRSQHPLAFSRACRPLSHQATADSALGSCFATSLLAAQRSSSSRPLCRCAPADARARSWAPHPTFPQKIFDARLLSSCPAIGARAPRTAHALRRLPLTLASPSRYFHVTIQAYIDLPDPAPLSFSSSHPMQYQCSMHVCTCGQTSCPLCDISGEAEYVCRVEVCARARFA